MTSEIMLLLVGLALVAIIAPFAVRIIQTTERGLVERLGKYHRTLEPGLNLIVPWLETMHKIDMREEVLDVPPQNVITRDNVGVVVDAVVWAQVTDPVRAFYEIKDYIRAATELAQTNLRNVMGEMDLDACLSSRDQMNTQLRKVLDDATDKWGVRINRVELKRIDPPEDITAAMSRQMKAERDKRAAILDAEAQRQAAILKAEGAGKAATLEAEGFAEALRMKADAEKYRQIAEAEGESQAINSVFGAIHASQPDDKLIMLKYLEMLPKLADNQANKIFLPYEASGMIGALAALVEGVRSNGTSKSARPVVGMPTVEPDEVVGQSR